MRKVVAAVLLAVLFSGQAAAQDEPAVESLILLEDAESGDTDNWRVFDSTPAGFQILNTQEDGNRFIALQGTDRLNAFIMGATRAGRPGSLQLQDVSTVSWRMRSERSFNFYFAVETSEGFRFLIYNNGYVRPPFGVSRAVVTGLGALAADGQWHRHIRDLQADLQAAEPGNRLLSINGVLLRGSVDIDDLIVYPSSTAPEPEPTPTPEPDPDSEPGLDNLPPVAQFVFEGFDGDVSGQAPLAVRLNPSASSDDKAVVAYGWRFGGVAGPVETTDARVIGRTFHTPGNYTITLIVRDAEGLTHRRQRQVTVLEAVAVPETPTDVVPPTPVEADPETPIALGPATPDDAARLLAQATFGATRADIQRVQELGIENWIDQQFLLTGASHLDYVLEHSNGSGRWPRHEIWWKSVVDGEDQLRQRVAFALSQIFVVSDTGYTLSNSQYGVTAYYQMLLDNAFGNYRDLLEKVTLSPVMGLYLSMLQNSRGDEEAATRADENYAREVLQLFSVGLHQLNIDGTTDGSPVFSQADIEAFARVFTGWNYADAGRWNRQLSTGADMISPMEPFEEYHDTDEKVLLNGQVLPAGLSAREDLERALDNIFYHPNVGPFIGKQLIKRLVTSNPSNGYVRRVSQVFNNDGNGIRGNLRAVIKAILMDSEARRVPDFAAYGKLREPVLRLSHLWRAFGVLPGYQSDSVRNEYNTVSPQLDNLESVTGQAVLRSPSVFNFYQPSFAPAGPIADQNLQAPEFELFIESNELATSNRIGRQIQQHSVPSITADAHPVSFLDFSFEMSVANEAEALLNHLNTLLMSGQMSDGLENALTAHLQAIPATDEGRLLRVRDAITLIMASPDYLVQM